MSFFQKPRASSAGVSAAAAIFLAFSALVAAEPPSGARVTLLPAGTRASVVIELDGESPLATAIEATDNQTVAVEIGPVRGKVVNQILQAPDGSPLVKQVRVRGLTQGVDGTVLTILIEAKMPVSGSVRRATRRVYIDLEPRDVLNAGAHTTTRTPTADDADRPTPTTGPKPDAAPIRPAPPVAPPPPVRSPAPGRNAPTTALADARPARPPSTPPAEPTRTTGASQGPSIARTSAPAAAPAAAAVTTAPTGTPGASTHSASAPPPSGAAVSVAPATASAAPTALTPAPPPGPASVGAPPSAAVAVSPAAAAAGATAATGSLDDLQRRAEQLTRVPDVKALQQLKAEVMARRDGLASVGAPTTDVNGLLAKFDQYVSDAQRNQLALDGSLFRGGQAPASGARASAALPTEPASPPRTQPASPGPSQAPQAASVQGPGPMEEPAQEPALSPAQNPALSPAVARAEARTPPPAVAPSTPSSGRSSASQAAAPALSIPAFRQAMKPIKPDLESVAVALGSWSGGALPPANLQGVVASLLARLRAIQPPTEIAPAHTGMCTALDALAIMWAKAMVEAPPEGTENAVIERARSAVDEFMRIEGALAPTTAAR